MTILPAPAVRLITIRKLTSDIRIREGRRTYLAHGMTVWHARTPIRFEQDKCFIEAVRRHRQQLPPQPGAEPLVLNDYGDGLLSLGPVLAAWESARQVGSVAL